MTPTFQGQQFAACPRQLLKELKYSSIHAFFQLHFNDADGIGERHLSNGWGGGTYYISKWGRGGTYYISNELYSKLVGLCKIEHQNLVESRVPP